MRIIIFCVNKWRCLNFFIIASGLGLRRQFGKSPDSSLPHLTPLWSWLDLWKFLFLSIQFDLLSNFYLFYCNNINKSDLPKAAWSPLHIIRDNWLKSSSARYVWATDGKTPGWHDRGINELYRSRYLNTVICKYHILFFNFRLIAYVNAHVK